MGSFDSQTAFVTGATGFLGYAVARALRQQGAEVRALTRNGALPGDLIALGVAPVRGDLHDVDRLATAMRGARFVFHVAADVRMWRAVYDEVHRTNVDGTATMLDAARRAGVARFVFTSSASTIGKPLGATSGEVVVVDETSAYNFAELGFVYPHTKWLAEEAVLAAREMDVIVTHPTAIFGPWDFKANLLPLLRASKGLLGRVATNGMRTVCDVRDVADGHLAAALRGRSGERYALGGERMSVTELLATIAAELGTTPPSIVLPAGIVLGVANASEVVAAITKRPPTLTREMAIQSCLRVVVSSAKAERELGYRSRPARESIAETVAFHRSRGAI